MGIIYNSYIKGTVWPPVISRHKALKASTRRKPLKKRNVAFLKSLGFKVDPGGK